MKILITGTAGFIGYHLTKRLADENHEITGLDSINNYYDPELKYARLTDLGFKREEITYNTLVTSTRAALTFIQLNLEDGENMARLFRDNSFDKVVNLAAQAGVRYSLTNPHAYINSNIVGMLNILEGCRHNGIEHLIYASSSSVYGLNEEMPFSTHSNVDHPLSLYAASKKSNELMAHTYSHLYNLPTTGLRFFTVYGPWGRPDMALFKFVSATLADHPIEVYNNGDLARDFTYIDDIIEGIVNVISHTPGPNPQWSGKNPDPATSAAPFKVYNIGNNQPVQLMDFIRAIEKALDRKTKINYKPMQPGDVHTTWADVTDLMQDFNYKPDTPIQEGVNAFVKWYTEFYNV